MTQKPIPTVMMMMLCMRCTLGGGEKRYGRVFQMLITKTDQKHKLLITRGLSELLQKAGILVGFEEHLIILDPPFRSWWNGLTYPFLGEFFKKKLYNLFLALDVLWYSWKTWKIVRSYCPEVVHPHLNAIYFSIPVLVFTPNVHYVMSANAESFRPEKGRNWLGTEIATWLKYFSMRHCDVIDALSESRKADVVHNGISPDKIFVNPGSFTDYSLCKPDSNKKKWVVFLARLIEEKGPHILVKAIPKILAKEPDVRFFILGQGYMQSHLERLLRDLNVAEKTTLRFETQPTHILNQSQIFTSLNLVNSYPNQALLEAMGCGNAIVATDVGENWRLVDEANGIRVFPEPETVADAIVNLLQDSQLAQKQEASRQRALTEHTPERFFDYITQVYREAIVPKGIKHE